MRKRASYTLTSQSARNMHRNVKFVDSFWETDYNGTLGFDLLCKRIREGQKTCKDIEDFFKKKGKIESRYGKELRGLANMFDMKDESGDLGLSLQEMRKQTERTAVFHENSAMEYTKLSDEVSRFLETVKLESRLYEDKVKEKQKSKRAMHSRMVELQKTYHEKCRDFIQLDNQYDVAKQSVTTSAKDIEKSRVKMDKSKETMERADSLYKQAVETLEQWRRAWTADMEDSCEVFQREEENRIHLLRDVLWKCTNIDSQLCVDWDETCETVRLCLEKCDVTKDVSDFIQTNRTGSDRPVPIEYESYFADTRRDKSPLLARRRNHPPLPPIPGEHLSVEKKSSLGIDYSSVYSYAN